MNMNIVNSLQNLQLDSPSTVADLIVVPLVPHSATDAAYLTLDEAIADHVAEITQVSEGGAVGQSKVQNGAKRPVLILDGEELVGPKQNRIVNLTILVAAASTLEIPVTCVEAGRWGYRTRTFSRAGRAHYASARAMSLIRSAGRWQPRARSGPTNMRSGRVLPQSQNACMPSRRRKPRRNCTSAHSSHLMNLCARSSRRRCRWALCSQCAESSLDLSSSTHRTLGASRRPR
jgi:hypothetical protein